MKAKDIKSDMSTISMLTIYGERQHYKFLMKMGCVFPSTKSQAKFFLQNGCCLDVLCMGDVEKIEELFSKHGHKGECEYQYTKSKNFVRMKDESHRIFEECLKKEYGI